MITINRLSFEILECCVHGNCPCSLAVALDNARNNTEFRIMSDISSHKIAVSKNVSNITITDQNNPTIRCDHQGGLVGNYFDDVTLQSITWDKCKEIQIHNSTYANTVN